MSKSGRIIEYDIVKCLAIFLVLWGHSLQHLSDTGKYTPVFVLISMFHMPLFMLVGGMFSAKSLKLTFRKLIVNKARQLLYPCISFGLLFMLVSLLWSAVAEHKDILVLSLWTSYMYGVFWFLKSMFFCYLFLYISFRITKNIFWGGLAAIIVCQFVPLYKINWMLPFFTIGCWLSFYPGFIKNHAKTITGLSLAAFIILAFSLFDEQPRWSGYVHNLKGSVMTLDLQIIPVYLFVQLKRFLVGITGSFAFIGLVYLIPRKWKSSSIALRIASIGRSTLDIYIFQTLILETILTRCIDLTGMSGILFVYLVTPLLSALILVGCHYLSRYVASNSRLHKVLYL